LKISTNLSNLDSSALNSQHAEFPNAPCMGAGLGGSARENTALVTWWWTKACCVRTPRHTHKHTMDLHSAWNGSRKSTQIASPCADSPFVF
jgi:hypothetical protein